MTDKPNRQPAAKPRHIDRRVSAHLHNFDKAIILASVLTVGLGVYEQINRVDDRFQLNSMQPYAASEDPTHTIALSQQNKEEKPEEPDPKDSDPKPKEETNKPDLQPLHLTAEQRTQINTLRADLKQTLQENPNNDIPYHDLVFQLAEISHNLTPEQTIKAYGEFTTRSAKLQQFTDNIHEFVHEVRATQGRYNPNLRSITSILLGANNDPQDPAGNCVARAENDNLHLLSALPEDKIFLQFYNDTILPDGTTSKTGHVRTIYEQDGKLYSTEGPQEIDTTKPGTLIVPLKEAVAEFAGLHAAVPHIYVPYYQSAQKDKPENIAGHPYSLFQIDSSPYTLMPYHGSLNEQKSQPSKKPFKGVSPSTSISLIDQNTGQILSQKQKDHKRRTLDPQKNREYQEQDIKTYRGVPAIVVPPNLDIGFEETSVEKITEFLKLLEKHKDDPETRDALVVKIATAKILIDLNHKKYRGRKFFKPGLQPSFEQSLTISDKIYLYDEDEFHKKTLTLSEAQYMDLLMDPTVMEAINFARENNIKTHVTTPRLPQDAYGFLLRRLGNLNIAQLSLNSPPLSVLESPYYKALQINGDEVIINPPEGFTPTMSPGKSTHLAFAYNTFPIYEVETDQQKESDPASRRYPTWERRKNKVTYLDHEAILRSVMHHGFINMADNGIFRYPGVHKFTYEVPEQSLRISYQGIALEELHQEADDLNLYFFAAINNYNLAEIRFTGKTDPKLEKTEYVLRHLLSIPANTNKLIVSLSRWGEDQAGPDISIPLDLEKLGIKEYGQNQYIIELDQEVQQLSALHAILHHLQNLKDGDFILDIQYNNGPQDYPSLKIQIAGSEVVNGHMIID